MPAVAFEAFEPLVYKRRRPLHPLGPSVFVLSIQSIRLIGSLTLSQDLRLQHCFFILCDSHGLQLLIKDILQLPWFSGIAQRAQKVVTAFKRSKLQLAILRQYQMEKYGCTKAFILRYSNILYILLGLNY